MRAAFLDMGSKMYGDSIFLDLDGFAILIDGGHPGDAESGANLPQQLKRLTGKNKTQVDLLVVTHSHDDHVGCLPRMVELGSLTARFALVSAPADRWAPPGDSDAAELGETGQRLLDLLGEELPDPQHDRDGFNAALDVAPDLKTRYAEMLETLKSRGTKVVRYHRDSLTPIKQLLQNRGLKILGPTKKHLRLCTAALNDARDAMRPRILDALAQDSSAGLADLYRRVFMERGQDGEGELDAVGRAKGAINNLSIVLVAELGGRKILLPGDMQFAAPETVGLGDEMQTLLNKVANAGPYAAVKLPHHTSYNGWNQTLHRQTLNAPILIHSGGLRDANHPEESVLGMMKRNRTGHTLLRTDRNGLITLAPGANGLTFKKSSGAVDDFTPNVSPDVGEPTPGTSPTVITGVLPAVPGSAQMVRVVADIPHSATKVVITVEVTPNGDSKATVSPGGPGLVEVKHGPASNPGLLENFATRWEGLLLVTNEERLGRKIGAAAVKQLRATGEAGGAGWLGAMPFPFAANSIQEHIATALSQRDYRGVIVLGDYDVTPPARFDCLPAEVRAELTMEVDDPDNFVVWSDGPYGDSNGDGVQEVPVSRVPDAGSSEFFWSCLTRAYQSREVGYMLRNVNRPFADGVHALLPKGSRRFESRPTRPGDVRPEQLRDAHLYLMLHGSDYDAARFWGEEEDGHVESINCKALPDTLSGVVFAGCCWGALIGREPAYRVVTKDPPSSRRIEDSMALSCLARGASAFVGCTGAHYSPVKKPYNYYGHPMHAGFWEAIQQGHGPAAALFSARQTYLENIPHRTPGDRPALDELAIELKLYQQFTCLGFGW